VKPSDLEAFLARLDALEARVAILEAERAKRPQMVYNWHLAPPVQPVYEHFIDPSMRETRNG